MRTSLLATAILASVAAASLHDVAGFLQHPFAHGDVDFTQWHPPTGSDARSPCPGLNSLANHGLLPRDGRNISIPILSKALKDGLNVGYTFSKVIGGAAIHGSRPAGSTTFDLDDLNKHGTTEHDGSISRSDALVGSGDNHSFNATLFDRFMKVAGNEKTISLGAAAAGRWAAITAANATNPAFHFDQKELALSYGESALYLSTLGHPVFGNPPTKFVEIFFREERLAWQEGWRPPHAETNLLTLPPMIFRLKEANPPEATKAEAGGLLETVVEMLFHKEHASQLPCWKGGPNC